MRALRVLAALLLLVGAALTSRALYMHAKAELAGILIRRAWKQSLRTGKPYAPWPRADMHPIARLQISRLHYDEIVLEGATPRTLAFGPARLMSGAASGEAGNLVIAGHRTSWFRPLQSIEQGDEVKLEWFDGKAVPHSRRYSVNLVRVVDPEDVTMLAPSAEEEITLITCYPFGHAPSSPRRFVVQALPILNSSPKSSSERVQVLRGMKR
ncbi:MAG TPA: class GN sortase [Terriglobales bacterium]|nr:class GN sortase [Terriglobales bacterium]